MKIGIVILNYNDYKTTATLLDKIENYDCLTDIIVVDNQSKDDSYQRLQERNKGKYTLIQSGCNRGYSSGNNVGIRYLVEQCKSDVIFIANPDILVEESVLKEMAQVLMKDQQLAILGANMLTADGDEQKLWLKLPHFYNSCLDCCWIGRQINKTLFKTAIDKSISFMKVETIPGSFFGVRADIIQKLNYLDENVFLFYEENILGFKVKQMGMYSAIMTKHNYIHAHNATIKKNISILNGYKVNLQSKLYFEQQYRKIGCLRTALLTLCMKYGVLEFSLALRLKSLFKL